MRAAHDVLVSALEDAHEAVLKALAEAENMSPSHNSTGNITQRLETILKDLGAVGPYVRQDGPSVVMSLADAEVLANYIR